MNPFSWLAFSNFFLIIGPSFRKKGCCHGRAVVPGPLVLEYSREIASAFLYTAHERKKYKNMQITAKKIIMQLNHSLVRLFLLLFVHLVNHSVRQSIHPPVSQSVKQSGIQPVSPSISRSVSLSVKSITSWVYFLHLR